MKVENYVLFGGIFRTSSPGDSISSEPEKTVPRRQGVPGEELGYVEVLRQRSGNLNFKKKFFFFCKLKKTRYPKLRNLVLCSLAQTVKCLPTMQGTWVRSLGQKVPLEKEMATHSSTLAWKTPQVEEPGRL